MQITKNVKSPEQDVFTEDTQATVSEREAPAKALQLHCKYLYTHKLQTLLQSWWHVHIQDDNFIGHPWITMASFNVLRLGIISNTQITQPIPRDSESSAECSRL